MSDFYSDFRHGSAQWATTQQIQQAGLYSPAGVYIGQDHNGRDLFLDGDAPICVVGGAGTGKGSDLLMYSAFNQNSGVYFDAKGELRAVMGNALKSFGKEVYSVNPSGLHTAAPWYVEQHGVNPFDILRADSPSLTEDIQMHMEAILVEDNDTKDGSYFNGKGQEWSGGILKQLVFLLKSPVTLMDFYYILTMISSDPPAWKEFCQRHLVSSPHPDIAKVGGEMLNKSEHSEREYSAIISTMNKAFAFLNSPSIQKCLSKPDFSLDVVTKKKAVAFLMIPAEYLGIWSSFVRLIITTTLLYKQRNPQSERVNFYIDEAAQLKKFDELERLATYGRGFGARLISFWQDVGQMKRYYGSTGAQTFLGSAQARLFLGARDLETAQMVSSMLGTQTIAVQNPIYAAHQRVKIQQSVNSMMYFGADPFLAGMEIAQAKAQLNHREMMHRALATPDEILGMSHERMIAFISGLNLPPIAGRKTPYFKRPEIARHFMPNPYHM